MIDQDSMGIYARYNGETGYIKDLDTDKLILPKEVDIVSFAGLEFYFDMLDYY